MSEQRPRDAKCGQTDPAWPDTPPCGLSFGHSGSHKSSKQIGENAFSYSSWPNEQRTNDVSAATEEPDRNDQAFLLFQAGHCAGMSAAGKMWSAIDCDEAWLDLKNDSESRWLADLT